MGGRSFVITCGAIGTLYCSLDIFCDTDLEKGNVDEGGVEVDELKGEHLEGEAVFIVRLCPRFLPVNQPDGDVLVDLQGRKNSLKYLQRLLKLLF